MKITKEDKGYIVELTKLGLSRKEIAEKFDISHQHVTKLLREYDEKTHGWYHHLLGFIKKPERRQEVYSEFLRIGMSREHADFAIEKWSKAYEMGRHSVGSKKQLKRASSNESTSSV